MKPTGQWKCRACSSVWNGSQLYQDPMYTVTVWTCGDLSCGGVCDRIPYEVITQPDPKKLIPTGEIPESKCPRCGHSLMVVTKRKAIKNYDGSLQHPQFVGCTQYPMCGYMTSKITPEIVLKMEAVQEARDKLPVEF